MRRRDFLQFTGGTGLLLLFATGPRAEAQETEAIASRPAYPRDFNAYLKVAPDGRVTCMVGKVELGQGAMTSLAMLLAEELDVALDQVDMLMGDTDLCPWDMGTFGSLSIWQFGPVLRGAGAEARAVLLQLASERLQVPVARLQVQDGLVSSLDDATQRVSYGQLVEGRRIERHLERVAVKPVQAFRIVGRPAARKDLREKVRGSARYAADFLLPGMLHARILRPPAHGARLKSLDVRAAERLPGVKVVRDGDLVAVLHAMPDRAAEALKALKAEYARPESGPDDQGIFAHLLKTAPQARVLAERGSLAEGERMAARVFEATYQNDYVAHAPLETHSAVARFEGGKLTVWASTQGPFVVKAQLAQALGLPGEKVRVITPYVGGGFGGKTPGPQAVEAARLARLTGRPVQVVWERAEEFFLDAFRPAAVMRLRTGLTKEGRICLWDGAVVGAGDREAEPFYVIPHQRTSSAGSWQSGNPVGMHPFAVGPWRAPSANSNAFARESQMDVMAAAAGLDPLDFRLRNLADERMERVLRRAAERFGWIPKPAPSGRGFGLACVVYRGTYVAACAEVSVDRTTGAVRVKRVVLAQDLGVIVNPEGVRQQVEGCITMGLGYALTEGLRFRSGEILDRNFDTYEIPRFSGVPAMEVILVENPEVPAQGCGEPAITVMGGLLANAIFDATGARLFRLPMRPEHLREAMKRT